MDMDSIKELAKAVTESLNLKDFNGDIVALKVVENEFGNIEAGGIGIQNNIVKDIPLTVADKDIKATIESLLKEKDDKGKLLFKNKKQWWAVYRVLSTFCQYPKQMTSFKTKITAVGCRFTFCMGNV